MQTTQREYHKKSPRYTHFCKNSDPRLRDGTSGAGTSSRTIGPITELYTEMGCKVGPRLRGLAPRGQKKPVGGFTQPRAYLTAHLSTHTQK